MDLVKAGIWWDFAGDLEAYNVHGVVLTDDEGAIFTGTKTELRELGHRFLAAVEQLPDDSADGTARTTVDLRKFDEYGRVIEGAAAVPHQQVA